MSRLKKKAPLPSPPPLRLVVEAEERLRQHGWHDGVPNFRVWVICLARVLWRHELGL